MSKFLGFLYFDTNALMKYLFQQEKGSNIVNLLIKNRIRYNHVAYTSQIAFFEIKRILKRKVTWPKRHVDYIGRNTYNRILGRLRRTLKQIIHVIDEKRVVRVKKFNYLDIMNTASLSEGDARHWAAVLNYLQRFQGVKIINSDKDFNKFIRKEGFQVIDPENIVREDLEKILT